MGGVYSVLRHFPWRTSLLRPPCGSGLRNSFLCRICCMGLYPLSGGCTWFCGIHCISRIPAALSMCPLQDQECREPWKASFTDFATVSIFVVDTVAKTLDFLAQLRHHLQESVELGGAYHGMTVLDDSTMRRGRILSLRRGGKPSFRFSGV